MRVRTHVNPLTYIQRMAKINYSEFLPESKYLDFEIGFGRGLFLKNYAKNHPDRNIIGIEIRKPVVEEVKKEFAAESESIKNVYLLHGKAEICLEDTIDDGSLDRIFLFHPDPWVKRGHHKRRVIQTEFLNIICDKLKTDGKLFVSTDVESLWIYMEKIINKSGKFSLQENDNFWMEDYSSHWDIYSKKDNRATFYGTFLKK